MPPRAVAATSEAEQFQILDQLSLLVDKSLVIADEVVRAACDIACLRRSGSTRWRSSAESGEASGVAIGIATITSTTAASARRRRAARRMGRSEKPEICVPRIRGVSIQSEFESALRLMSSLQRIVGDARQNAEGIAGFEFVFSDDRYRDADVAPAVWVRAVADRSILTAWVSTPASLERAQEALAAARELGDAALTASCLAACGAIAYYSPEVSKRYLSDAIDLARASGDRSRLCYFLSCLAVAMNVAGQPIASQRAAEEGRDVADASR